MDIIASQFFSQHQLVAIRSIQKKMIQSREGRVTQKLGRFLRDGLSAERPVSSPGLFLTKSEIPSDPLSSIN